jgi:hypothetical protein
LTSNAIASPANGHARFHYDETELSVTASSDLVARTRTLGRRSQG